jgi:hypothetical protein
MRSFSLITLHGNVPMVVDAFQWVMSPLAFFIGSVWIGV